MNPNTLHQEPTPTEDGPDTYSARFIALVIDLANDDGRPGVIFRHLIALVIGALVGHLLARLLMWLF